MSSTILQFLIVNAIPLALGMVLLSLMIFIPLHRLGKGGGGAFFAFFASLLYLFIPLFGGYLTLISGVMLFFVRVNYIGLSLGAILINILNVLLFSPLLRANAVGAIQAGEYKWAFFLIALVVLQVGVGITIFLRYLAQRQEDELAEPFDCYAQEVSAKPSLPLMDERV
ncbi:MAG: hypothetical protein HQL72_02830 [Magnetococcales bacterium]|nr:hypothetical protein [Magnetococcales bacterium]